MLSTEFNHLLIVLRSSFTLVLVHRISITFINYTATFSGDCLKLSSWMKHQVQKSVCIGQVFQIDTHRDGARRREREMLKHKQLHRSVRKIRSTKSTYTELVQYVLLDGIIATLIHIILIKWRTRINSIYSVIQLFSCTRHTMSTYVRTSTSV